MGFYKILWCDLKRKQKEGKLPKQKKPIRKKKTSEDEKRINHDQSIFEFPWG